MQLALGNLKSEFKTKSYAKITFASHNWRMTAQSYYAIGQLSAKKTITKSTQLQMYAMRQFPNVRSGENVNTFKETYSKS